MRVVRRQDDGWYVFETSDLSLDGPHDTKPAALRRKAELDAYIARLGGLAAAQGVTDDDFERLAERDAGEAARTTRKKASRRKTAG